jgi:predicted RNA-binding Zn-ribbon protein involved in translation (DUF1610 family)
MCFVPTISVCFAPEDDFASLVFAGALGGIASGLIIRWIRRFGGKDPGYEAAYQASVSSAVHLAEHYAQAWRSRRRRIVIFKTIQISFFAVIFVVWYLSSIHPQWRRLILALPAWFIAYMAAGLWLNRFRCPRCGKLYYWRAQLKGSRQRQMKWRHCRYCGLQQDQDPSG